MGLLAVMLNPVKANILLGFPSNLITNKTYDLQTIIGHSAIPLLEKLNESKSSFERICHIEEFFLNRIKLNQKYFDPRLSEFEKLISNFGGNVNIKYISEHLNISKRQLERIVFRSVGLTPKEFSKIIRFQKTLHMKQLNTKLNITELAYRCGFSDQAHFINDFKSISGYSPKKYFEITDSFSDYYTYI